MSSNTAQTSTSPAAPSSAPPSKTAPSKTAQVHCDMVSRFLDGTTSKNIAKAFGYILRNEFTELVQKLDEHGSEEWTDAKKEFTLWKRKKNRKETPHTTHTLTGQVEGGSKNGKDFLLFILHPQVVHYLKKKFPLHSLGKREYGFAVPLSKFSEDYPTSGSHTIQVSWYYKNPNDLKDERLYWKFEGFTTNKPTISIVQANANFVRTSSSREGRTQITTDQFKYPSRGCGLFSVVKGKVGIRLPTGYVDKLFGEKSSEKLGIVWIVNSLSKGRPRANICEAIEGAPDVERWTPPAKGYTRK